MGTSGAIGTTVHKTMGSSAGAGGTGGQDRLQPASLLAAHRMVTWDKTQEPECRGDSLRNMLAQRWRVTGDSPVCRLSREAWLPDLPMGCCDLTWVSPSYIHVGAEFRQTLGVTCPDVSDFLPWAPTVGTVLRPIGSGAGWAPLDHSSQVLFFTDFCFHY